MAPRRRLRGAHHRLALVAALCGCGGKIIRGGDASPLEGDAPRVDATDVVVAVDASPSSCARGLTRCGSRCVDTVIDPFHCGSCARACAVAEFCIDGACVAPCNAPSARCEGRCVDVTVDANHCGACERACVGGTCRGGRCRLPTDPGVRRGARFARVGVVGRRLRRAGTHDPARQRRRLVIGHDAPVHVHVLGDDPAHGLAGERVLERMDRTRRAAEPGPGGLRFRRPARRTRWWPRTGPTWSRTPRASAWRPWARRPRGASSSSGST